MDFENNENNSKKLVAVVSPVNVRINEASSVNSNNSEPVIPMVKSLKCGLKDEHRGEIRNFNEITDITRYIAKMHYDDEKNIEILQNLNYERQLHGTLDYHVRRIRNSDNSTEISTALKDVHERKQCFDEQYNFINNMVRYSKMDTIYPGHLLNMSFERQRLLFKHIFKNNYSLGFTDDSRRVSDEGVPQAMYREGFYDHEVLSIDSSDSDSEQMIASIPVQRADIAIQDAHAIDGANQSSQEQVLQHHREYSESKIEDAAKFSVFEDIAIQGAHPMDALSQSSQEQIWQQIDREHSEDKTEGAAKFSVANRSLLSPGCSKWTRLH